MSIAVLFAEGFEEIEAVAIVDVLRRAGLEVRMAGVSAREVRGAHGIQLHMDCLLADLEVARLQAVVLPGGMPGSTNLRDNPAVIRLLQAADRAGKWLGAICAAPIALQAAGLLKGKTVTCFPGTQSQLPDARYTGARTQVDGRIVTGAAAGAAIEFALELVACLDQPATAQKLRQGMLVKS